jgi:hypothetical protein
LLAAEAANDIWSHDMSDKQALLEEKNKLISEMLEMQKQFIEFEHEHGIGGKDYYYSQEGLLKDYREKYNDMAVRLVDISHELVGSSRWM